MLIAPKANITPKRYNLIQTSITNHAKRVNLRPCEVQSILWLTHKIIKMKDKKTMVTDGVYLWTIKVFFRKTLF